MSAKGIVIGFVGVLIVIIGMNSLFVVTEFQRAVLLRFGEIVRADLKPGLHIKMPFINNVRFFDARVLTVDAAPERFLTLEKKAVIVDSFAKYRVVSAEDFYTSTSGDINRIDSLLRQRINTGLRNEISKRSLHEVVSGERDELMTILSQALNKITIKELGVEMIDVRVKKIDLPVNVSQSVFNRMNTERDIEAQEHRAQGKELAAGVSADADRQREIILAEAYSEAEKIRGEGDAKAASTYAAAFNKDKEFYKFYRSMGAYKKTFSHKGDILLIDPDSDFFEYFNQSKN